MDLNTYIPLLAIFVSMCALIFTIYESTQTRKHQRLSVKPALDLDIHSYGDKGELKIEVTNKGLGPAFISKYSVLIDNERINSTAHGLWKAAVDKLGIDEWKYEMYIPTSRTVLSPGVTHCLWKLYVDPLEIDVIDLMDRIKVEIEYKSAYNETSTSSVNGNIKHENI